MAVKKWSADKERSLGEKEPKPVLGDRQIQWRTRRLGGGGEEWPVRAKIAVPEGHSGWANRQGMPESLCVYKLVPSIRRFWRSMDKTLSLQGHKGGKGPWEEVCLKWLPHLWVLHLIEAHLAFHNCVICRTLIKVLWRKQGVEWLFFRKPLLEIHSTSAPWVCSSHSDGYQDCSSGWYR